MSEKKILLQQKTFDIVWGDMDALGHVNNVRYFDYFQEARIQSLRDMGLKMTDEAGPILVHVACTYLKPIFYPATLKMDTKLVDVGNTSFVMEHDVFQNEVLMAQGLCKIVWYEYKVGKAIAVPDSIRGLFG